MKIKGIAPFLAIGMIFPGSFIPLENASIKSEGSRRDEIRQEIRQEIKESLKNKHRNDEIIVKIKGSDKFRRIKISGKNVDEAIAEFRANKDIEYAEPNYIAEAFMTPNDTYLNYQWHLDNPVYGGIKAKAAWDNSEGLGVTVAVIDTGIAYENYTDPATGKTFAKAPDFSGTCFVPGYDFVTNDTHANDENSHGTHVAGTIAQSTNDSYGTAGVAYKSCLMPIRVLDANGSGSYADVAEGIRFAADNGAKVINLSLGGPTGVSYLEEALAYAYSKGVTIVAASGNDSAGTVSYPAAYNNYVIAVGATRYNETRAPYSNYGTALDVVAPGGDTTVDQNGDGYIDGVLQNTFNPTTKNVSDFAYYFLQGTSMATPHVAGVAALVISKGNAVAPADVRTAIESTADDLGTTGRDNMYGYGIVDAAEAVLWTKPAPPAPVPPPPTPTPTPTPAPPPAPTPVPPPPTPTPPPPATPVEVFSDSFEVSEWNSLWTEDNQNDWFRSAQRAADGTRSAEIDGVSNNSSLNSIAINLQGKTNAKISFSWFIESSLDNNEYIAFDVSTNGGSTWTERARIRGNTDPENSWQSVSIDLNGISQLKLRFRGKMSDSTEDANLDMVKVSAW